MRRVSGRLGNTAHRDDRARASRDRDASRLATQLGRVTIHHRERRARARRGRRSSDRGRGRMRSRHVETSGSLVVSWKYIALVATAAILLSPAPAHADCAGHPEWEAELPHEVDTPKGNHLSYRYDWS